MPNAMSLSQGHEINSDEEERTYYVVQEQADLELICADLYLWFIQTAAVGAIPSSATRSE